MNIFLKEINEDNWRECIALKIRKEQEVHLPHPNAASLIEWKFKPDWVPMAIYVDDIMVGFLMYGTEKEDGSIWLIRFMIDEKYQGKAYGKYALGEWLRKIKETTNYCEVKLSFHPQSIAANKLYSSFGFKQFITGFEAEDEIFYKIQI